MVLALLVQQASDGTNLFLSQCVSYAMPQFWRLTLECSSSFLTWPKALHLSKVPVAHILFLVHSGFLK